MAKYTVTETRQIHSINPANASGLDTLVTFVDEARRADTVTVDGNDPTPDEIRAAIEAHVARKTKHAGLAFDIG